MRIIVLLTLLIPIANLCLGQSLSSGSGDETYEPQQPTDQTDQYQLFLEYYCSQHPDVCDKSPSVCPCGSFEKTLIAPNNLQLLNIYPCSRIHYQMATYRECDAFIEHGATRAVLSLNEKPELEYLYLKCFTIFSDFAQPDDIANSVFNLLRAQRDRLRGIGIVGPSDPSVLELLPYVTGNFFQQLTISYSTSLEVTENKLKYPYFYSTVPSPTFFTKVVLQLLSDFGWRRVAIVSSRDAYHLRNSEHLLRLGSVNDSFTFSFANAYDDDPTTILEQFQKDDFRIFVANIESSKARNLFCKALRLNLTTPRHQWILPSFYDYKWWHEDINCTDEGGDPAQGNSECCTNDEILEASVSTIFVGESSIDYGNTTRQEAAINVLNDVFEYTVDRAIDENVVQILPEDRLFLLHSRVLYAIDAVNLFALAFNDAIRELQNSTVGSDAAEEELCDNILTSPPAAGMAGSGGRDILTEKMNEVLQRSIFCGYSGYYVLANSSSLGQAWITQLQYYDNCTGLLGSFKDQDGDDDEGSSGSVQGCYKETDIGHYSNINKPRDCDMFKLQHASVSHSLYDNVFQFTNSCCDTNWTLITSGPYKWKGDDPWKPPNDGGCHDDSCICLNRLSRTEIVLGLVITLTGLALCCVLLSINFLLRNNKHIKASSPRFNSVIIIGCMIIYTVPVFKAISLSGNYFNADLEKLIPISCEVRKWLSNIGFTLIVSTMVCRSWRIYRIFFNPRIKERKFLSDFFIMLLSLLLVLPTLITIAMWTIINPYEYQEVLERSPCPNLHVDDSIATFRLTIQCTSEYSTVWSGSILAYVALLGSLLIFLAYQNSTILSHFAQEGEFASKAMFLVTLFIVPTFLMSLIIEDRVVSDPVLVFWSDVGYHVFFPTILLIGLYLPKFILIITDKRYDRKERRTTRLQQSLQQQYESKLHEREDLMTRLRTRQDTLRSFSDRNNSFSSVNMPFQFPRNSPSPSPLTMYDRKFFEK